MRHSTPTAYGIDAPTLYGDGKWRADRVDIGDFNLDHLKSPITHLDLFSLTDNWFLGGNGLLFAGFGLLYILHHVNGSKVSTLTVSTYTCGWNYFAIVGRIFIHIHNLIEIRRNFQENKKRLALEVLDMGGTMVMAVGTTLSMLAIKHVIHGLLAIVCAPMASLTPALCAVITGVIECYHLFRAYQNTRFPFLLKNRMKNYSWVAKKLKSGGLSEADREAYESLKKEMREQILAIARVGYFKNKFTAKQVNAMAMSLGLEKEFNASNLFEPPTDAQVELVAYIRKSNFNEVRNRGFSAAFWFLVGIGVAMAAVSTFFFPLLLAPAILVIGFAVLVKSVEVLELDKRIINCFISKKKNKKEIANNNPFINYLARRKKRKAIEEDYLTQNPHGHQRLGIVPLHGDGGGRLSEDVRIKLRIAYELSARECAKNGVSEAQFYQEMLGQFWWTRAKMLNRAMDTFIERLAMRDCRFSNGLTAEDRERYTEEYCRRDYRLFGTSKKTRIDDSVIEAAEKGAGVTGGEPAIAVDSLVDSSLAGSR